MRAHGCVVYALTHRQRELVPRTLRALEALGLAPIELAASPLGSTSPAAASRRELAGKPLWFVRAGSWPRALSSGRLAWPEASATGAPLCAVGAVLSAATAAGGSGRASSHDAVAWSECLRSSGGDLGGSRSRWGKPRWSALPPVASVYLDAELARVVLARLAHGDSLPAALEAELPRRRARVVRHAPLDVFDDPCLRVAQVVTSVQQGGAERIAVELARALPGLGVRSRVYALYRSARASLDVPPDSVDIAARLEHDSRATPLDVLGRELAAWGTDVAHAHLLDARELEGLAAHGQRSLVTVHNLARSWPAGLATLDASAAALLVACAHAVEADVVQRALPIPCRTVWNGIRPVLAEPPAEGCESAWRRRLGVGDDALLLVALANCRPQKRLELLPAILAATRAELAARGAARDAHLVIAGSSAGPDAAADAARQSLERAIDACGVRDRVHCPGSVSDVPALLAAADVLVAPSAFEGLSLAQLEALAAGLPVVASGAGGTSELAALSPDVVHLPLDAAPERYARAILAVQGQRATHGAELVRTHFSSERMARAYARLYPRALARQRPLPPRDGLWLITNNFSTGGAQSSARRLLVGLAQRGVRCRAAVIQESPEHPTVGRRALAAASIPVLAVAPPDELEPAAAVAQLLAAVEADPPEAIVLWNVIPEHKLLLAEGALDLPIFDVSPGEMYFASLARQFAAPRPDSAYRNALDYGARLAGVIVKYAAELPRVKATLGVAAHVIPNGIPLGPAPSPRDREGPLVIGTAVRIHPDKKLDTLLAALRLAAPQLGPYVLRIAGGVEEGAEHHAGCLRQLAHGLNVEWCGELADTRAFLSELDLFALVAEPAGCPNASLEAMALGLPVVATAVGGMSEQI
ncbi:MAG TPA: glycosyltransferase, partial [Polyangiaceae bacterium]|nr:glycosyltransferase [Polyangiaceae bacterium]